MAGQREESKAKTRRGWERRWRGLKEGAGFWRLQSVCHRSAVTEHGGVLKTGSLVSWSCQSCEEGREVSIIQCSGGSSLRRASHSAAELKRLSAEGRHGPGLEQWVR